MEMRNGVGFRKISFRPITMQSLMRLRRQLGAATFNFNRKPCEMTCLALLFAANRNLLASPQSRHETSASTDELAVTASTQTAAQSNLELEGRCAPSCVLMKVASSSAQPPIDSSIFDHEEWWYTDPPQCNSPHMSKFSFSYLLFLHPLFHLVSRFR